MKKGAVLIVSGLLVLLAAALVAPTFIDWNRYRSDIAGRLAAATGRDISLESISFRVLPRPTLRAHGVTIANVAQATSPYFARIGSLNVQVALLPLLTGDIAVQNVVLREPHVVFETVADGRVNWRFGDREETDATPAGGVPIDRLIVARGHVEYRNAQTDESVSIRDVNASLEAETLSGPFGLDGTGRYQDIPVRLAATLSNWHDDGRPAPLKLSLTLPESDSSATFSGTIAGPLTRPKVAGTLSAKGKNFHRAGQEASRLAAFAPPTLPTTPFTFESALDATAESIRFDPIMLRVGKEEIDGAIAVESGPERTMDVSLSASRLDFDSLLNALPEKRTATAADGEEGGSMVLPEDLTAAIDLSVNAADFRGGIVRQIQVRTRLQKGVLKAERVAALFPGGSDVLLSGVLRTPEGVPRFEGTLKEASGSLRSLLTWAGVDASAVPADRLAQFTCRSDMLLGPNEIRLSNLDVTLDNAHAVGSLALEGGDPPAITADLDIDRFTADAYMPTGEKGGPFSLAAMENVGADLAVRVGRLSYADTMLSGVTARTVLTDGVLSLDSLKIDRWGGATVTAEGTLSGFAKTPRAKLAFTADGPSFERFLAATGTTLPATMGSLGRFTLTGGAEGSAAAADLHLAGAIGDSTLRLKGRAEQLGTVPAVALDWTVDNPSLAAFIRQTGLPLDPPAAEDDTKVAVEGRLKGGLDRLDGEISIKLAGGTLSLSGRYGGEADGSRFELALSGHQKDPVAFVRALGFDYRPAGPLGAAEARLSAAGNADAISIDLSRMAIGDMTLTGTVRLDRTAEPPLLTAKLNASAIDLDALLAPMETGLEEAEAVTTASAAAKSRARWSREPIDWSALAALDADIRLTADAIGRSEYRFTQPTAHITIENGVLKLDPLSGGLFGGDATLRLVAQRASTPRIDLALGLDGASVEKALLATTGDRAATGTLDFDGDFTTAGDSQYAMIRNLKGRSTMTAANGVIRKIDLPRLSQRLNALERIEDFLSLAREALSGGETPYTRIAGTFNVTDGVARTSDTQADVAAAEGSLEATVDLPNWQLDATGQFRLTEHPQAPPVRVHLTGPIDAPRRDVQIQALQAYFANRLGAALIKRALGREKQGVGGLFGDETRDQPAESEEPPAEEGEGLNAIEMLFEQLRKRGDATR